MYTKQRPRNIIISVIQTSEMSAEDYCEIQKAPDFDIMRDIGTQDLWVFMEVHDR